MRGAPVRAGCRKRTKQSCKRLAIVAFHGRINCVLESSAEVVWKCRRTRPTSGSLSVFERQAGWCEILVISASLTAECLRAARDTMSGFHVRRDKAALFQWVQGPPDDRSSRKQPGQE